ncbi:peptidase [Parvularcula sp. LCG005]|uniref:peptidase n=1 Tax=Parvularcula sp. LCG005 TaxID=3078805 RepID=UPI0029438E5C|nr:peptidase [Parvularcula sp. LCG005]WOI51998.1 peptidase [Parvularcula sp. LCG005]
MTYCVALRLKAGLVMLSDTRTNAGIDSVSKFRKMFTWCVPGERALCLMTAGNLSITQSVITTLQEQIDDPNFVGDTMLTAPSLYRAAEILAQAMRDVMAKYAEGINSAGENSGASIILAGQRKGGKLRLYMIYSAGNFIEASEDTPFFQIGGFKYGKPILDRVVTEETSLEDGKTAAMLSMDSTLRSNLAVGMPLDLCVIPTSKYELSEYRRIEAEDPNFRALSEAWSQELRDSFVKMRAMPK